MGMQRVEKGVYGWICTEGKDKQLCVCVRERGREREKARGSRGLNEVERVKGAGFSHRCERLGVSHFSKSSSSRVVAHKGLMLEISPILWINFSLLFGGKCTRDTSGGTVCAPKEDELWMWF